MLATIIQNLQRRKFLVALKTCVSAAMVALERKSVSNHIFRVTVSYNSKEKYILVYTMPKFTASGTEMYTSVTERNKLRKCTPYITGMESVDSMVSVTQSYITSRNIYDI
jgi:hypothetical protein